MKQSLQFKIGQHLTMTPQLQQAIRLLQLSSLELQLEIQEALYSNPLLDVSETEEQHIQPNNSQSEKPQDQAATHETLSSTDSDSSKDEWPSEIPTDLPVDANWDDIFSHAAVPAANSNTNTDNRDFDSFQATTNNFLDHLKWQLNLAHLSELDRHVGASIIDAIDANGFLSMPIEEVWQGLSVQLSDHIELDEVVAVLHCIQHFDPPGVAAHDLRECLLIQLNQLPVTTPLITETKHLVAKYLTKVGERDFKFLERKTGLNHDTLLRALNLIQSLSPHPGELIRSDDTEYVVPDVRVKKINDHWRVTLNKEITPNLCINETYAKMVKRADSSKQNQFLRDNLQEAKAFLRSLEGRNDTLLRVSSCIVEMQRAFLEHGAEAMKPLVLADIAEHLELHESTISRVTTQKFIDTPQGVFELKYFFSSHVNTSAGGQCSSTAIRAKLKKMIAEESSNKPLSDSKLATILAERGIKVARRTVAKYRESLNIPSSSERKRYKHD